MKQGRGLGKLLGAALALVVAGGGCSLIVAGDVPDFQCSGTSPSACPSGLTCETTTGQCVADAGDTVDAGDEAADDGGPAEAGRDADADAGPLGLGAQCRIDADCKSQICGTSTILTPVITQNTGPICTTPCCNSGECAPSFVCFNGGTGGGYCVPAALAQRTPPAAGGKAGGDSCTLNADCRSGLCTGTPKACLDTCCTQSECADAGSSTCRIKSVSAPAPAHDIWVCAAPEPGATKQPGDTCPLGNLNCATDNCLPNGSGLCRPSCSSTASCKTLAAFSNGHCLYGQSGSDFFKFCANSTPDAGRTVAGVACADKSTCQSDYCDAELKKCADVCGRDADCAATEACRPSAANTPFLRCVPKP